MERSLEIFLASIKSESTKISYLDSLKKFKDFLNLENNQSYDDIVSMNPTILQRSIEDYILFMRKNVHPNSIRVYYFPIQSFLEMNDIMINFKKMRRLFPETIKSQVERGWTTEEIQRMLEVSDSLRTTAIIHFENSSGGRIGIFQDLKIKHLKEINDERYGKCYCITGYAGSKEEYITFLTPEATKALDRYLDTRQSKLTPDSPVFLKLDGSISSPKNLSKSVYYVQRKAGLRNSKDRIGSRFSVPSSHGFRHRFNEIIKSSNLINPHTAERLLSHSSKLIPLDTVYFKPDTDTIFSEYRKIIPLITVSDSERLRAENNSIKIERSAYEELKKNMEDRLSDLFKVSDNTIQ
ncbi:site-specific integrase [Nitrososphaeria virus YSH_1032793]|uniref:Integrase n=1 Tax=Nitrososphaeria virus YSH_1032793 TaxID=3071320 RepID=A0A976UAC5_9CAUD|nr:site-specific integrase [Yangshan Harbor Nitrososphaeria virus]UVF62224.1 site-specific integrase [Nitrososphaeria virus YSH_1032793]